MRFVEACEAEAHALSDTVSAASSPRELKRYDMQWLASSFHESDRSHGVS